MPIIYRPDFVGDAIANVLSNESIKDTLRHDRELAARKKRQKTTAIIGTAAGAAIGAGFLAPSLGLAGTAAGGVTATEGIGAGISSVLAPATTGLLGTGGVVGLGGYLTAGAVGAQLGGQLAGEDYAGAIGTAASAVNTVEQARRDQQIYGYQPSREGRATTAALAAKAGITIDRAAQIARQRGVSVDQVLAEAQGAADDRAIENERYGAAAQVIGRQQGADALAYLNDDIEQFGGNQYAGEPDDGAYMEAQKQRSSIESDIAAGNITRGEANQLAVPVRQLVGKAALGRKQRKPPTVTDLQGVQRGPSSMWETDGIVYRTAYDSKGNLQVEKVAGEKVPQQLPPWGTPDKREQWLQERTLPDGSMVLPEGLKIEKPQKTATDELLNKVVVEGFKPDSTGEIPFNDPATLVRTVRGVRSLGRLTKLDEEAQALLGKIGTGTLTLPEVESLAAKLNAIPGAIDDDVKTMMDAAVKDAIKNMPTAAPATVLPPTIPAPLGSAASAEERAKVIQQRTSPEARAIRAMEAKAQTERERVASQKRVREATLGGLEAKETLTRNEQALVNNIAAGIDEEVTIIKKLPDERGRIGRTIEEKVVKGAITPELRARLKAEGWSIPGLED
jgi:hypothetical protein